MITRNSPLPILRRVCKLSRRQLVLARISNPLILSNTFALLIHRQPHPSSPLTQPIPNPKMSRYLTFAKTQTQTHTHKSHQSNLTKPQKDSNPLRNTIDTSQPPHALTPQTRKPGPRRRRSRTTHLVKRAVDARVELPPDLLARAVRRRQHVLREGACFFEFGAGGGWGGAAGGCGGGIGGGI